MNLDDLKPRTLHGVKSLAKKLKKRDGVTHTEALKAAAKQIGFDSYESARKALGQDTA